LLKQFIIIQICSIGSNQRSVHSSSTTKVNSNFDSHSRSESKFGFVSNIEKRRTNVHIELVSGLVRAKSNSTTLTKKNYLELKRVTTKEIALRSLKISNIGIAPDSVKPTKRPLSPRWLSVEKAANYNSELVHNQIAVLVKIAHGKISQTKTQTNYSKIYEKLQSLQ
jgi:hypothetical protein